MANFSATTWAKNFWQNVESKAGDSSMSVGFASIIQLLDGEIDTSSDTQVSGWLYAGGRFTLSGSGLNGSNPLVSRIQSSGPAGSVEMIGQFAPGGALGIYGNLSFVSVSIGGVSEKISGDLRFSQSGQAYAFSSTSTFDVGGDITLTSVTNSSGRYTSHTLKSGSHTLTATGDWAYGIDLDLPSVFAGADILNGTPGDDFLRGYAGNDTLVGGSGLDTAVFSGVRSQYSISKIDASNFRINSLGTAEGSDTLQSIERIMFADSSVALDTAGVAGMGYRLYKAAFDRTPDLPGLGFWIRNMDVGNSLTFVANEFIKSAEFKLLYGENVSDARFVELLYQNVLDRLPDPAGWAGWQSLLANGKSRADVLIGFSESPENQSNVISLIGNGIVFTEWGT